MLFGDCACRFSSESSFYPDLPDVANWSITSKTGDLKTASAGEVSSSAISLYKKLSLCLTGDSKSFFRGELTHLLEEPSSYLAWSDLLILYERCEKAALEQGYNTEWCAKFSMTQRHPIQTLLRGVSIVTSLKTLFLKGTKCGLTYTFTHIILEKCEELEGEIHISIRIPDNYPDSRHFFEFTLGVFKAFPLFVGLSEAVVTLERETRHGYYKVILPESFTIWQKIWTRLCIFFNGAETIDEVLEARQRLNLQNAELKRRLGELDNSNVALKEGQEQLQHTNQALDRLIKELDSANESLKKANEEVLKQKIAAEEALETKEKILGVMNHEYRTPINKIFGLLQMLRSENNVDSRIYLESLIENNLGSLSYLLGLMLDINEVEQELGSRQCSSRVEEVGVLGLFNRAIAIAKSKAEEKSLGFVSKIDHSIPRRVTVDAKRFAQLIYQLLDNAIKFTDVGQVAIYISLDDAQPHFLKVVVEDTGIGIAEQHQERIFRKFEQVDGSITRRYGGAGLGLAYCKNVVTLLHGTMDVHSHLGQGSRFTVRIPFTPVHESKAILSHKWNCKKVLIVDDELLNRKVLARKLLHMGLDVDVAVDGVEAVKKVIESTYAMVFMDVQMPNLSGPDATIQLRQLGYNKLVILAVTAHDTNKYHQACSDAGMNGFISKPVSDEYLKDILEQWNILPIQN